MFYDKLTYFRKKNDSILVVGLDTDINRINGDIFDFNRTIIDETKDYACAFKLNIAFYEELGSKGFSALEKTVDYIRKFEYPIILDVKRGDIANTASAYARAYFNRLRVDSITANPYMGRDSIEPYMEIETSHVFVVALTSNEGAADFELPNSLYAEVVCMVKEMNEFYYNRVGIVVGATQKDHLQDVTMISKGLLWLVPGIGTQGGDLEKFFLYTDGYSDIIINSSRSIIFSQSPKDSAKALRDKINLYRRQYEDKHPS